MSDVQAKITLVGEDQVSPAVQKAAESFGALDQSVQKASGGMESFFKTALATATGFQIDQIFEKGVAALKDFTIATVNAGAEMQTLTNRAEVLFGSGFTQGIRTIDDLATSLGRSKSEMLGFAVQADAFTQSMGMSRDHAEQLSIGMSDLAVKIGQATGKNEEEAFMGLERGLRGMGRALIDVGINLDANTLKAYLHAQGIEKDYTKLDDASKAIVAYNYVLSQKSVIEAQAAKNQDTYTEKTKEFWGAWKNLEETLGGFTVGPATGLIEQLTQSVKDLSSWTGIATLQLKLLGGPIGAAIGTVFEQYGNMKTPEGLKSGAQSQDEFYKSTLKLTQSQVDQIHAQEMMKGSLKELPDTTGAASKKLEEMANALDALSQKYDDSKNAIDAKLQDLELSHESKVASIQGSIVSLQDSLKDLAATYGLAVDDMNRKGEDLLGKQDTLIKNLEEKLKTLQNRAAGENSRGSISVQTNEELDKVKKEIAQAQAEQPKIISTLGLTPDQIAAATAREGIGANLIGAQDLVAERARKANEFANKSGDIQGKIAGKEGELGTENANYEETRTAIKNTETAMQAFHVNLVAAMHDMAHVSKQDLKSMDDDLKGYTKNLEQHTKTISLQKTGNKDVAEATTDSHTVQRGQLTQTGKATDDLATATATGYGAMQTTVTTAVTAMNSQLDALIAKMNAAAKALSNLSAGKTTSTPSTGSSSSTPAAASPAYHYSALTGNYESISDSDLLAMKYADASNARGNGAYVSPNASSADLAGAAASKQGNYGGITINLTGDHVYNNDMDARTVARTMASEVARAVQLQQQGSS